MKIEQFPPSVTHLAISCSFYTADVANFKAMDLIFSKDYIEHIINRIPTTIKHLTFHESFNDYQPNCIPIWVEKVTIIGTRSERRLQYIQQFIPKNCKLLVHPHY